MEFLLKMTEAKIIFQLEQQENVNVFSQVRLIDAGFLWTEPHSKRIKMKVTIQKEVRKQWKWEVWGSGI